MDNIIYKIFGYGCKHDYYITDVDVIGGPELVNYTAKAVCKICGDIKTGNFSARTMRADQPSMEIFGWNSAKVRNSIRKHLNRTEFLE